MKESLFIQLVEKYFSFVIGKISEKFNGKKTEPTLLHKTMLTEEYSADLNWGASTLNHSIVAADYVSLDSSLPLKKRGSMGRAQGTLPKIGIKYRKDETDIDKINTMIAKGTKEATIVGKLFDDAKKSVKGVDIRNEIAFQYGLSTGYCLATEEDNNGTGIRVNFGFKPEHMFKTLGNPWSTKKNITPQDDIQQLFDMAEKEGDTIGLLLMSKTYFDIFRKSPQGRLLAATYQQQVIVDKTLLAPASRKLFAEAIKDEYSCDLQIVDGSFKVEHVDGTTETVTPWEQASIVGVPERIVGRLVYGTLAEETNPVEGVVYGKVGAFILVKKYSKTDPLEEFTSAEARAIPVIDNGEDIYLLNASERGIVLAESSLAFPKSASNRETAYTVGEGETVTATSDASWLTVTVEGGKVKAAAAANTGEARTAEIEVKTSKGYTATITVTQADGASA